LLVVYGEQITLEMIGPDGPGDGVLFRILHQHASLGHYLPSINHEISTGWELRIECCPEVDPEDKVFWLQGCDRENDREICMANWDDFRDILLTLTGALHVMEPEKQVEFVPENDEDLALLNSIWGTLDGDVREEATAEARVPGPTLEQEFFSRDS